MLITGFNISGSDYLVVRIVSYNLKACGQCLLFTWYSSFCLNHFLLLFFLWDTYHFIAFLLMEMLYNDIQLLFIFLKLMLNSWNILNAKIVYDILPYLRMLTAYKNNKHENILRLLFKISNFLKFDCFISSLSNQMLKFLYIFFIKITHKDVLKSNFTHF